MLRSSVKLVIGVEHVKVVVSEAKEILALGRCIVQNEQSIPLYVCALFYITAPSVKVSNH